jgi:hypothetical protein
MLASIRFAHGQLLIAARKMSIVNRCCNRETLDHIIDSKGNKFLLKP